MTIDETDSPIRGPELSDHFKARKPSATRTAQIEFLKRDDGVEAINTAIGNVSLAMHPAMQHRMVSLGDCASPFSGGVVKYSCTVGLDEARKAVLNIIGSSGLPTKELFVHITAGGSAAMEMFIIGVSGPAGTAVKPLFLVDAAYPAYTSLSKRLGRKTVSVQRVLSPNGKFSLPDIAGIEAMIEKTKPGALVIIPYDNPTGHYYKHETLVKLAKLCVKYNMWMASDEAYRELYYVDRGVTSIWGIGEEEAPGITGRRISIETASKVWNACGLRIGALVTDNHSFHVKSVAEYTANLCTNVIGQYIFGALADESHEDLNKWYEQQRSYYKKLLLGVYHELKESIPGLIVSSPDASIYSVVDVSNIVKPGFNAEDFVIYCAREGCVEIDGKSYTLLIAPMTGFYHVAEGETNPGLTQMRISFVETPDRMALVPRLFASLLKSYESSR